MKLHLSIVIPCLNEKDTVALVISDAKKYAIKYFYKSFEIVVADNGSNDGTLEILKKIKNIKIVNVPIKGYGAALHWGIINSRGEYVVFADADMSYPFWNLRHFKRVTNLNGDLILGSRIKGKIEKGAMPNLHRYVGTPILTLLIRVLYKIPTTDCNSGMRMIKRSFYNKLNMKCSGMEWASELLLKTALQDGKYLEVPIIFKKDMRNRNPHLNTWADGWRHLKSIILLKPNTLNIILIMSVILSVFFLAHSFSISFLFANISIVLFLSILTLDLLGSIINNKKTKISTFLQQFKLVPVTILVSLFVCLIIIFIPENHLGTKLFFVSILGVIFMWIFFIETIKTHLINRLPDAKK